MRVEMFGAGECISMLDGESAVEIGGIFKKLSMS